MSARNSLSRRQHEYRVGAEMYRRHAPLHECSTPTQRAGWLRAYEYAYGYTAARTYLAAWRELQDGVFDPYAPGGYRDEPGYSEAREFPR